MSIVHDLRTPLTAARASAELQLKVARDEKQMRRLSQMIIENLNRADRMIIQILEFARLDARGGTPLKITPCVLRQLIENALRSSLIACEGQCRLESKEDIQGYWDSDLLRRAVENLVSNAAKYGTPNAPIYIRAFRKNGMIQISVQNTGNELSVEDRKRIFKTFERTRSAESSGIPGWGMGLAIVCGIVEAHRGTLDVESDASHGTTFTITLPLDCREGPSQGG